MNIASIDIGSNTILLMIASYCAKSGTYEVLCNEYKMPRISEGLKAGGAISDEKIDSLIRILKEYKDIVSKYDCEIILCNATNALRIASNGNVIVKRIKSEIDLNVNIIPGEQEAYYSFLGAITDSTCRNNVVIDIGGGSTEISYGNVDEMPFSQSFPIGVVSLTEKFFKNNPPNEEEISQLRNEVRLTFGMIVSQIPPKTNTIAVAGTPTTLSCVLQNLTEYRDELVEGSIISLIEIVKLIDLFKNKSSQMIREEYGYIMEGREDVILAGALILEEFMRLLSLSNITVSSRGVRFGAIVDYVNRMAETV